MNRTEGTKSSTFIEKEDNFRSFVQPGISSKELLHGTRALSGKTQFRFLAQLTAISKGIKPVAAAPVVAAGRLQVEAELPAPIPAHFFTWNGILLEEYNTITDLGWIAAASPPSPAPMIGSGGW